jgi:hypothetical protein
LAETGTAALEFPPDGSVESWLFVDGGMTAL